MKSETSRAEFSSLSWGDAYERYRPLLLHTLAGLSRTGFLVAPDEGLDLIQDFFIEAWHGLLQRYDPTRASPETYIFRAFTQFARRRILHGRRRAEILKEVARVGRASVQDEDEPESNTALLASIQSALVALPTSQRAVLHAYLSSPLSERALARQIGVSRYRIRELLIAALSSTAEAIKTEGLMPESVREAALGHWREGISPEQTARKLGITASDVRSSRSRLLHRLAGIVRHSGPESIDILNRGDSMMNIETLLRQLFSSPGDSNLLNEIRQRSAELIAYLEKNEFAWDELSLRAFEQNPQWAGQVFEALAGETPLDADEQAALDELIQIKEEDDQSIGRAFKNGLMRDLEAEFSDWSNWFEGIPEIAPDDQKYLAQQQDVIAAAPVADPLLRYGVTPLTLFYATLAVNVAVERLARSEIISGDDVILLTADPDRARDEHDIDVLPAYEVAAEIISMSEVTAPVAWALLRWLVAVGQVRSFLFPKFEAVPEGRDVRLKRVDGGMTLEVRWSQQLVPA